MNCLKCGRELSANEIGLHKKLINRGSAQFMCIKCLGKYFELSTDELERMIEKFKSQGCTLF